MITATGLVTRGLVEGLGAAGPATRGLVTAIESGEPDVDGPIVRYQPRHWRKLGARGWERRVP